MSRIALFFNHPVLGGAERSAVEQAAQLSKNHTIDIYFPGKTNIPHEILSSKKKGVFQSLYAFEFPKVFSGLNRKSKTNYIIALLGSLGGVIKTALQLKLQSYDVLWMNGVKVFVFFTPVILLSRYEKKIYFHLRDYVSASRIVKLCIFLLEKKGVKITFIANSNSINNDFQSNFGKTNIVTVYNLCELKTEEDAFTREEVKVIGMSSMLTPWKGIHSVITFAGLYEEKLRKLGVERIAIYGAAIYNKTGDNQNYEGQLRQLKEKLSANLIYFEGNKKPEEIYQNIDLLIHASNKREPFGRILLEAYLAKVPLLSTGLGGSFELIANKDLSVIYLDDYEDIYQKVKNLIENTDLKTKLITEQLAIYEKINIQAKSSLNEVFSD